MIRVKRFLIVMLCILSSNVLFPWNFALAKQFDLSGQSQFNRDLSVIQGFNFESDNPLNGLLNKRSSLKESSTSNSGQLNLNITQKNISSDQLDKNIDSDTVYTYWLRSADLLTPQPTVDTRAGNVEQNILGGINIDHVSSSRTSSEEFDLFRGVTIDTSGLIPDTNSYTYLLSQVITEDNTYSTYPDISVYSISLMKDGDEEIIITLEKDGVPYQDPSIVFENQAFDNSLTLSGLAQISLVGTPQSEVSVPQFRAKIHKKIQNNQTTLVSELYGIGDYQSNQIYFEEPFETLSSGDYTIEISQIIPLVGEGTGSIEYPYSYYDGLMIYDPHTLTVNLKISEDSKVYSISNNNKNTFVNDVGLTIANQVLNVPEIGELYKYSVALELEDQGDFGGILFEGTSLNPGYLEPIQPAREKGNELTYDLLLNGNTSLELYGLPSYAEYRITYDQGPRNSNLIVPAGATVYGSTATHSDILGSFTYEMRLVGDQPTAHLTVDGTKELLSDTNIKAQLSLEPDLYTFVITPNLNNPVSDPVKSVQVKNVSGEVYNIPLLDVDYTEPGVYSYLIRESDTTLPIAGITYDASVYELTVTVTYNELNELVAIPSVIKNGEEYTDTRGIIFTNTYDPGRVSYSVNADLLPTELNIENGSISLTLEPNNKLAEMVLPNSVSASNLYNTVNFPNLIFTQKGTYSFRLSDPESAESTFYIFNVNVDEENGILSRDVQIFDDQGQEQGQLTFTKARVQAAEVLKTYPLSLNANVTVVDEETGKAVGVQEKQFRFNLVPASGNDLTDPIPQTGITVTNDILGIVPLFSNDVFINPGTYAYTLTQEESNSATVDDTVYTINVVIRNNNIPVVTVKKEDSIAFRPDKDQRISFINTTASSADKDSTVRTPALKPVSVIITGNSLLDGAVPNIGEFTYRIKALTKNAPMPEASEVSNNTEVFTFSAIKFDTPGTYEYELFEVEGNNSNIVYDNHKYKLAITIKDNGKGSAVAEWKITDLEGRQDQELIFNNTTNTAYQVQAHINIENSTNEEYILGSGELNFSITPESIVPGDPLKQTTVTNSRDGSVNLLAGTVYPDGIFSYEVSQIPPENDQLEYDASVYQLMVRSFGGDMSVSINDLSNGLKDVEPVFTNELTSKTNGNANKAESLDVTLEKVQYVNGEKSKNTTFIAPEDTISYSLVLTNSSKETVNNVTIQDVIPKGLEVDKESLSNGVVVKDGVLTYSADSLDPNTRVQVEYTTHLVEGTSETVFNSRATASINNEEIVSNEVSATLNSAANSNDTPTSSDSVVTLKKTQAVGTNVQTTDPILIESESTIVYKLSVTNNSEEMLDSLSLTDVIDSELSVKNIGNGTVKDSDDGSEISWEILELGPGETEEFNFSVTVPKIESGETATYTNVAQVSYPEENDQTRFINSNQVIASSSLGGNAQSNSNVNASLDSTQTSIPEQTVTQTTTRYITEVPVQTTSVTDNIKTGIQSSYRIVTISLLVILAALGVLLLNFYSRRRKS